MTNNNESPIQVVLNMILGWETLDLDAIKQCFHPDAEWLNTGLEPVRGIDQIMALVSGFFQNAKEVNFELRVIEELSTGIVATERVDNFIMEDGSVLSVPVAGFLQVENGLIVSWRDYFDASALS